MGGYTLGKECVGDKFELGLNKKNEKSRIR